MSGGPGHHTFDTVRSSARAELTWFLRHADALRRWPVLGEAWAQTVEARRLEAASPSRGDGTPSRGVPPG